MLFKDNKSTELAQNDPNSIFQGAIRSQNTAQGNLGAVVVYRSDIDKLYNSTSRTLTMNPIFKGEGQIALDANRFTYFSITNPNLPPGEYAVAVYAKSDKVM